VYVHCIYIIFFITADSSRASSIAHSPRQSLVAADALSNQHQQATNVITQYDYDDDDMRQPPEVHVRHTVGCWRRFCRIMKSLCCYACPVYPVCYCCFYVFVFI
jgi:hypothetical protein